MFVDMMRWCDEAGVVHDTSYEHWGKRRVRRFKTWSNISK